MNQLKNYAAENLMIQFGAYKLDLKLYSQLESLRQFKVPEFVITNKENTVLFHTSVDSLAFYDNLIKAYLNSEDLSFTHRRYNCKRIKEIGGYHSIVSLNEFVFVELYYKNDRIYVYNTTTGALDSIHNATDSVQLTEILKMNGDTATLASDIIKIHQTYDPYQLHTFGHLYVNDNELSTRDIIQYVGPNDYFKDTISPHWMMLFLSYNPITGKQKLVMLPHEYDEDFDGPNKVQEIKEYWLDDYLHQKINDTTFVLGAENYNLKDTTKLNLTLLYFDIKLNQTLQYRNKITYDRDSFLNFDGTSMNLPFHLYPYFVNEDLLYFHQSPNFKIRSTWYNIKKIEPSTNWIQGMTTDQTNQLLTAIVSSKNDKTYMILFDLKSKRVIKKYTIPHFNNEGFISINGNKLTFLDKVHRIIQIEYLSN